MNLVSVDFEKAFNRMDHGQCLSSLHSLGATEETVSFVAAFLYGRKMSVKIKGKFSAPRDVPAGAPQGSILGGYLFCATTDQFASIDVEVPSAEEGTVSFEHNGENDISVVSQEQEQILLTSTPSHRRTPGTQVSSPDLSLSENSSEDFDFFRVRRRISLLDSTAGDPTHSFDEIMVSNSACEDKLETLVYIDCLLYTSPSPRDS